MMTTAAYPATMPDLRGEPAHSSIWSNYGTSAHLSSRLGSAADSPFSSSSAAAHQAARPRIGHGGMEHQAYGYGAYGQDDFNAYDRHSAFSNLKRSFSQAEPPAFQEMVQDLREDGSRLTVNQDHKLLAFRPAQDKTTIVDRHGRVQQMELSAQLHGMFFLSELPSSTSDGCTLQPELTCYRRNLFQISGSLVMPRGQLSIMNEANEAVPVTSMELAISAIESVDGNPVRLIVIPWKTPPPNSTEVSQAPDQEPPTLPLIPFQDDGAESDGDLAVYPIGWRRLQFRIATANNGRRKELQQHFVLHLKVFGTLADSSKAVLMESTTAPIVVRGRSPRNFQARKEIPLLGSSAGSRGQALVETGLGVVASAMSLKHDSKLRGLDVQVPRSPFTFSPPRPQGSTASSLRSNSYSSWSSHMPSSSPGGYGSGTLATDPYAKLPLSGGNTFSAEQQEMPLPASMGQSVSLPLSGSEASQSALRPQYTYSTSAPPISGSNVSMESAFSMPRYLDGNPRPSKSPRQAGHQSVHGGSSMVKAELATEYRYAPYRTATSNGSNDGAQAPSYSSESSTATSASSRDYYPSPSTWTTTTNTSTAEQTASLAYPGADSRSYPFSSEAYKNGSSIPPLKPDAASSSVYSSGPRGSFDSMSNYSWSTA